jgi:UDP-N-acetyl-D-mannosaminuronic acid dehydrogenase
MNPNIDSEGNGRAADICIVGGAGHVGLPLAIVFAAKCKRVVIYDKDQRKLDSIRKGSLPFMEDGAESLLREILVADALHLTNEPSDMAGVSSIIITIGTPIDEFLHPSFRVIQACIDEILPFLSADQLLVLRSTVYPGVTDWLSNYLKSKDKHVKVAFCPERIVQGCAIKELQTLPQIVSGTTPAAEAAAGELFRLITSTIVPLSPMEAEFAKLFSNAYRYVQFSIANQFFMMTSSAGVDYYRVLKGMQHNYPRLAGLANAGFAAGPCLLKDTMQLAAFYDNYFNIGHVAMLINEGLPLFIVNKLMEKYDLQQLTIGLLGMAFKANNDDIRSSLSYKLKKALAFRGKEVLTTDPYVTCDPEILPVEEVVKRSDIVILCTPHQVYKTLDLGRKIVVDVWNFWENGGTI